MTYHKFDLNEAKPFLKKYLADGLSISKNIVQYLKDGNIYTYAPENSKEADLYLFTSSNIVDSKGSEEFIANEIIQHLSSDKKNLIIIENMVAKRGMKFLEKSELKIKYFNDEVFVVLDHSYINRQIIVNVLNDTNNGWRNIIYFSRINDFNSKHELIEVELTEIQNNINKIVIAVYDSDGYLYWENPLV